MRADVFEFANSCCLATCGNWLLMVDHWSDLYILNLFTHEWIYLPPVDSQLGPTKVERTTSRGQFCISNENDQPHHRPRKFKGINMILHSPAFWIDEQTKEYVVLWGLGHWCVVYSKKGDTFWSQIQTPPDYFADYSQMETFHCGVAGDPSLLHPVTTSDSWRMWRTKLVVTVTGDVLKVEQLFKCEQLVRIWSFRVYKVCSSDFCNKHDEKVDSLGDEAMLLDLGITVLANDDIVGFRRNSIYFNDICYEKNTTQICVFNLETQGMEETLHMFVCSSEQQLARARWFLPSNFKQT
ncbi:PREDICTED: probable F-box protein At4g22165 [Camelina sativa]|uniref:Probable F-box protein At4g22165 n=1 Tax=Camelina sativa TaxID=90675 RepID=A0ABM0USR3_CAMSA|nr:PREDICTED: probable F-box protein At4g22165 [Camelina sativa]